jgi:hypothetical protein
MTTSFGHQTFCATDGMGPNGAKWGAKQGHGVIVFGVLAAGEIIAER